MDSPAAPVRTGSLKKVPPTHEPPKGGALVKLSSTPKSEIPLRSGSGLKKSASTRFSDSSNFILEKLPSFKDVNRSSRTELFVKKINQCHTCFDFTDAQGNLIGKEIKKEALLQCIEYLVSSRDPLNDAVYSAAFKMVAVNLFRPLPPHVNPFGVLYDPEEDEPILEAAWAHIQIVYEFLLRLIDSSDFNSQVAKVYIDTKFIQQLLELFDSEDPRERDYLKTTLHRIYGKFLALRVYIRTAIRDLFCTFVYETGQHNGIAEILEVLGSIINGFAVPLKDEHKHFLTRVLLPLHKPKGLTLYHSQLSYCICQFLDKEPDLIDAVFISLLRIWPASNSPKEVLFLAEVEELLNIVDDVNFKKICVPLFKQIAKCFKSQHFQVAEKALYLWSNDHIVSLVADGVAVILPLIYSVLNNNANNHWNRSIRSLSIGSLQLFQEIDPLLYNKIALKTREEEANRAAPSKQATLPATVTKISKPAAKPAPPPSLDNPPNAPPIRRKSLLPYDPSTIAALSDHKSLESIISAHEAAERERQDRGDDSDSSFGSDNDDFDDDEDDVNPSAGSRMLKQKMRSN